MILKRLVAVIALSAVGIANADEDFRKLIDLRPPVLGPVWTQGETFARGTGFPAMGVSLMAWIPLNNFPGGSSSGNDCWGYVSQTGREYAIMGLEKGFGFVEITDPANPVIVETIVGPTSLWHDVKVIGQYAYGVSEAGSGIQVMDLSDIDNGNVTLVRNFQSGGHSSSHNIVVNEAAGTMYLVGANIGNGGLINLDLTDPTRPTVANGWTNMYIHDACVVSYTTGPNAGREIAFCASGFNNGWDSTGLRIVDVTDKNNMFTVSTFFYTTPAYSHQVWVSPDFQYAYLDDELDEMNGLVPTTTTRVIDISDLNNPFQAGTFTSGSTSIDHNLYTRDQYIFESNYTSGLRVFDATDPVNPTQIAYFDTVPSDDNAVFTGAWNVYPYFPSGTVIVSDMSRGLFVLRIDAIDAQRLSVQLVGSPPDTLDPNGGTQLRATIVEDGATLDPGLVVLAMTDGQGTNYSVPGVLETGNQFLFTTPALPCGDQVSYYISAQSTDGDFFYSPLGAPTITYDSIVASSGTTGFDDNFEANLGWSTASNASDGQWNRGVPVGGGDRGDPGADYDGSGRCYLTDNVDGNSDVDDGTVTLTSPNMDAQGAQSFINYGRWYSNTAGASPQEDIFVVEISNDGGSSWTNLETVGPSGPEVFGGWVFKSFRINDIFSTPSNQFRIRFMASDLGSGSVVEAGVDAVSIVTYQCDGPVCEADRNGDGTLDFFDVQDYLSSFAAQDPSADLTGDGVFDFFDVQSFLQLFSAGCP
jgi:choice-of-anchor B domain-containing protein